MKPGRTDLPSSKDPTKLAKNRNQARDARRRLKRVNRFPRVFIPELYSAILREFRSENAENVVRVLSEFEMDAVRTVERMKTCGKCHDAKDTTRNTFHRDNREPDGWYWKCKECRREKV